ncbi:hypothetical protein [Cellulomonas shaoxiangyii]|uniref:Uncharacterized protein n=1 Tax=Cellulomonas shaoxiangyii TaxID=2566013 RepID=A0A4P7SKC8_9CELL|nr:hypothetical protein [Cellulomonas shaoxiangyii]QCB94640.1 hypothetical protein E5225_14815 [Cellulomonas shaoxiangyii]TGY81634.1 hypothetical protein E5226_14055 [Cellulomonas shaoxiangyii]
MPDLDAQPTAPGTAPTAPTPVAAASTPHADGGGLDDLYDIARLARRLDVEHATIRVWLSRKVPWLPPPDGRLNGGAVWRATTLEGIEERRFRRRPGRKPRFLTAPAAADVPRTGPLTGQIPIVDPAARTGAVAAVAAATGQIPVVPVTAMTGAIPTVPIAPRTGQVPVVRPRGRHAALTGPVPTVAPRAVGSTAGIPPTA